MKDGGVHRCCRPEFSFFSIFYGLFHCCGNRTAFCFKRFVGRVTRDNKVSYLITGGVTIHFNNDKMCIMTHGLRYDKERYGLI